MSQDTVNYAGRGVLASRKPGKALKRGFDLIFATLLIVLFAPVMVVIAAAIRIDSPGPILFRQVRHGYRGQAFVMYKFRSMYVNADQQAHRLAAEAWMNAHHSLQTGIYKIQQDRRITNVGKFIRGMNLDEFPQLFNVLKGEMSIVGPRPAIDYEYENYSAYHKLRLCVLPGMTGPWQVSGWQTLSFDEMVALDVNYIENWSFYRDMIIIFKTIPLVLFSRGQ